METGVPRDPRCFHPSLSSLMIDCRSPMLSRFINGILQRRPGMLGLDQLIA
jgi:hypothetical protein